MTVRVIGLTPGGGGAMSEVVGLRLLEMLSRQVVSSSITVGLSRLVLVSSSALTVANICSASCLSSILAYGSSGVDESTGGVGNTTGEVDDSSGVDDSATREVDGSSGVNDSTGKDEESGDDR